MGDPNLTTVLNFLLIETDQASVVPLDEVMQLILGDKKRRRIVHDTLLSSFNLTFSQTPGHKDGSPRGKYAGIWKRTAEERLGHVKLIITCGTAFEASNLEELFHSSDSLRGDSLTDVQRIVTGLSVGGIPMALLEPTTKGPYPQYAAMRELLKLCPNAVHIYKSGGFAGTYDMGEIIVAVEDKDSGIIVEDHVMKKKWGARLGFPGPMLRQAAYETPKPLARTAIETGADLISETVPLPYEIESSGFLCALERHGAFNEKTQIGIVGVVTHNYNIELGKKTPAECFQDLIEFWKFFLNRLDSLNSLNSLE